MPRGRRRIASAAAATFKDVALPHPEEASDFLLRGRQRRKHSPPRAPVRYLEGMLLYVMVHLQKAAAVKSEAYHAIHGSPFGSVWFIPALDPYEGRNSEEASS